jgi:hypothetical protein
MPEELELNAAGTATVGSRCLLVALVEMLMASLKDTRQREMNTYEPPYTHWPREFLTLAVVSGCVSFWALVLMASGTI